MAVDRDQKKGGSGGRVEPLPVRRPGQTSPVGKPPEGYRELDMPRVKQNRTPPPVGP